MPNKLLTLFILLACLWTNCHSTDYITSWVGNTFGGDKWIQLSVEGMYVAPDGTLYLNSFWDEGGREAGIYKNGDVIGLCEDLHGWNRGGAMVQDGMQTSGDYPPPGTSWYCVRRYNLAGQTAPFTGGRGWDSTMLIISINGTLPTGLATLNDELFVSDPTTNSIRVFDVHTLKEKRSWKVSTPSFLTFDSNQNIWVLEQGPSVSSYSIQGNPGIRITGIDNPSAIAGDIGRKRLLVADNGPSQQVLIYDLNGRLVDSLGAKGGIYSGNPGVYAIDKFSGINGVGVDSNGNYYVGTNGFIQGTILRAFDSNKIPKWELFGLTFIDNADVDPSTDGIDVYTKQYHFKMDYSKPPGQQWSLFGYSLDAFKYPDDPRLNWSDESSVFVRRIGSRLTMWLTGMYAGYLVGYRFDNEIAVPCVIFSHGQSTPAQYPPYSPAGSWLWRDLNGDGNFQRNEYQALPSIGGWAWEVDNDGNVWIADESKNIWNFKNQGFDSYGGLIYSANNFQSYPYPSPFNQVERVKYISETDTLYIGGFTVNHPYTNVWGIVGREIVRYNNWSKTKDLAYRIVLPYRDTNPLLIIKAMDIWGGRIFAVDSRFATVYYYDSNNGNALGSVTPGPQVFNQTGWVDIPYGLRAFQRSNGEYLVFVEDDWKSKVVFYVSQF